VTALRRSSAIPLVIAWVALIVYASLYPFGPWVAPTTVGPLGLLGLSWPRRLFVYDAVFNIVGYLPLGALVHVGAVRAGRSNVGALAVAVVAAAALSYTLELLQWFLPRRVPSVHDVLLNTLGAFIGAVLAAAAVRAGALPWSRRLREHWFGTPNAWMLVLLLLWPLALLVPPAVPFALGQLFDWLRSVVDLAVADTPWQSLTDGWPTAELMPPLGPVAEALATSCGMLTPVLLAYSISRPGWRRIPLLVGAALLGFGMATLSTALGFGPEHALAWLSMPVLFAALIALAAAFGFAWLPARLTAAIGLVVVTVMIAVVAQAPADPYYALSLQQWEQGRFVRFHGLARWLSWLWPYGAMVALIARLGARDAG
jgi:VanZ family protein